MFDSLVNRSCNALARHADAVLTLVLLLTAASLLMLPRLQLDMSFRPLFAEAGLAKLETRAFAAEFGQPSGAFIGVITTDRPDEAVARAARFIEFLPGISQVITPEFDPSLRSRDGRHMLLLARVDLPLQDLPGRSRVIEDFKRATAFLGEEGEAVHYIGISVVEAEYARLVGRSVARSLVLTTLALVFVLGLLFRRPAAIVVALAGVTVTLPIAVAILGLLGQRVTIVNSMVPTMILIIGVADAIHMLHCWIEERRAGCPQRSAIQGMLRRMLLPCFLTSLTTALGFLSLRASGMGAIRAFGTNAALGIALVFCFNTILMPILLRLLPERWLLPRSGIGQRAARWCVWLARCVLRWRRHVLAGFALVTCAAIALLPRLKIDQRSNQDVSVRHPVRRAQALLEREFGGVLGPEVVIGRADGESMLTTLDLAQIQELRQRLLQLPDVQRVESVFDLLPRGADPVVSARHLLAQRARSGPGASIHERIGTDGRRLALLVRVGDIGTRRAMLLVDSIHHAMANALSPEYRARVVGEWYLAQLGMHGLLRDMLVSFATSALVVLPILALALRSRRLLIVAILPNVLPMLFALAFMAATGISVRIGTAMILAIALAIAVDDTIHFLTRLRAEPLREHDPEAAVAAALHATGPAMLYTTAVLVLGFLSMGVSDLLALRDMCIVAAATMVMAAVSDLVLAPALFLQLSGTARLRDLNLVSTSSDGGTSSRSRTRLEQAITEGAGR